MTSVQPVEDASTEIINWTGDTGLEDFDRSDISMPRMQIEHADALFRDSQTDQTFEELTVILLGLHKGRLMWPAELAEGNDTDAPLCKSPDFKHGFPNLDMDLSKDKRFPWHAQTNYSESDLVQLQIEENGIPLLTTPSLACAGCRFREWNTAPDGKKPWCAEEWTLPMLYLDPEDESWNPALFSTRRSGVKPTKNYLTPFVTKKIPLFTSVTKMTLDANRRGSVKYCTPSYEKVGRTDEGEYMMYRESFLSAKSFLSQFPLPRNEDDDEGDPALNDEEIKNNTVVIDAEVEPEPEPEAEPEEKVFRTAGKVKQPTAPTVSHEDVTNLDTEEDDDEPPF
jgi:hypothetical protein